MDLNFSPTITPFKLNLIKTNDEDHQLIYPSQLYGTFFAVCAKLNLDETKQILESMDLTLVNYKGLYNLGMVNSPVYTHDPETKTARLTLHLSAFRGVHGNDQTLNIGCNETPIAELEIMKVSRHLLSFYDQGVPIENHLLEHCFDSEFYERDGAAIRQRVRMDDRIADEEFTNKADIEGVCKNAFLNCV